jgi:hypothetical protein
MPRMLVRSAAVVTVLAASACASAGDAPGAHPDVSTTEPADGGAVGSAQPTPDSLYSTDAAVQGDPGVPGLPESSGASVDDVLRLGAVASWAERPELIALSLPASSSCWASAAEPVAESPTLIVVEVAAPEPCEAPDAARTYSIPVPEGVDPSADLQLEVVGLEREFTLTLPAG